MAGNNIRIGKISSINYNQGMVNVVYPDKDNAVTTGLPYIMLNGEYKMPKVGNMVLVLHLSNGGTMGVVMGGFWNKTNKPHETGKGLYRKELAEEFGEAYIRYLSGELRLKAAEIIFQTDAGGISVSTLSADRNRISDLENRVSAIEKRV